MTIDTPEDLLKAIDRLKELTKWAFDSLSKEENQEIHDLLVDIEYAFDGTIPYGFIDPALDALEEREKLDEEYEEIEQWEKQECEERWEEKSWETQLAEPSNYGNKEEPT